METTAVKVRLSGNINSSDNFACGCFPPTATRRQLLEPDVKASLYQY
jgi:hypothetical protein